jgi:6-phosphogluconate dehydrogenase (decarboxylating)
MEMTIELGVIDLRRMGGNSVHLRSCQCALSDQQPSAIQALNQKGVTAAAALSQLLRLLNKPCAVSVMLSDGEITEKVVVQNDICRAKPSSPRASTRSMAAPAAGSGGLTVPAEVLFGAPHACFPSRKQVDFADKLLSPMVNKFGGHLKPKVAR